MGETVTLNLVWWITAVELPALAGLFWLTWRTRREAQEAASDVLRETEHRLADQREQLAAFKLDVAKTYVSVAMLKDVESRITSHLIRIEDKLDYRATPHGGGRDD